MDLHSHPSAWPETIAEATRLQNELRHSVRLENDFPTIRLIAGIDVSIRLKTDTMYAVAVLIDAETLAPIADVAAELPAAFPYVPGYLSFREIPAILEAMKKLPRAPDLLMVDGHGVAHPRRLGIAAHLGALIDRPAIGVAKSKLTGTYHEPDLFKGAHALLMDKRERIGTVLRSKDNVKPLFVSPGHRVDHDTAVAMVQKCLTKYRLPEPTRLADKLSKIKKT